LGGGDAEEGGGRFSEGFVVLFELGEVGGFFEGRDGLEVGLGFDG